MRQRLDPGELEARTLGIGRELFDAARREHAHLSVLNRWTAQVLSWCLSDPSVKGRVLRFIDVLPSLRSPRDIARHVCDYFPTSESRLPPALRMGASLARSGLLTHGPLAAMIRQLVEHVARQFIAESRPDGARAVIHALAGRGATASLDVLGEQVLSEAEAEAYVARCRRLVRDSAEAYAAWPTSARLLTCGPHANLSVKPSALTPWFDPISPARSLREATQRLQPLVDAAAECRATITLDMEQSDLRDLTIALAKGWLSRSPQRAHPGLGVVLQAYLCDAEEVVDGLLAWLAAQRQSLTIRLVKGAYWDSEVALAAQRHWPVPVYQDKASTDLAFERLTERLLCAHPTVTTAIASHNVRSIAHAMAVAERLGLPKTQMEFQFLYGMGETLRAAVIGRGYPVRVYTPIGELIPGMAYLVRRLLENTANESFLRQELFQERDAETLLQRPEPPAAHPATDPLVTWQVEPPLDFSKGASRDRMSEALARVRAELGRRYSVLIGSQAVETDGTLTVHNPSNPSEVVGVVAKAGEVEVEEAVQAAARAQPGWANTPVDERVACLRRAAQRLRERRLELAAWTVFETGKPWREADMDLVEAIEYLEYYSHRMLELTRGASLRQVPGERNTLRYLPRGVAVVIAPWNFPAAILTGMAASALVTGNAVILKPAEQAPVIAAHLAQALRDAGIPPGAVQYLPGLGEEVGATLVRHPGTHTVLFTGSKAVGLSIIEAAARALPGQRFVKHVVAEMGGKNAVIVDADADLDAAVQGVLRSAFGYAGQKCSAASRVIVLEAVHDRFLSRLAAAADRLVVGDPGDPATDMGPLIDHTAQRRLLDAIAHAREVATIAYQCPAARIPSQGHFVGPAIVTEVPRDDRLAKEELFGPLLGVFRVKTFEEALALANDVDSALTGGVYSRSPSHVAQAVRDFDVGNLYLNRPITGALIGRQPFGGHRLSGLGTKAGGPDYLLQLVIPQTVCENTMRHGMPLE